jgi:hypothetical protein
MTTSSYNGDLKPFFSPSLSTNDIFSSYNPKDGSLAKIGQLIVE